MKKKLLTGSELARHVGKSPQAIDQARKAGKLHRDATTKRYDCSHDTNVSFIESSLKEPGSSLADLKPDQVPEGLTDLYTEKLSWETKRTKYQAEKLRLQLEKDQEELLPSDLVCVYLSAFNAGISTNLLTLGNRIARGDMALRDRIEKEVKRGLERTKEDAAHFLQSKSKIIYERMKSYEENA